MARERDYIVEVLEHTGWKVGGTQGAAKLLGLKPTTLEHACTILIFGDRGDGSTGTGTSSGRRLPRYSPASNHKAVGCRWVDSPTAAHSNRCAANRLPRGRTYVRNGSVLDLRSRPPRCRRWSAARRSTGWR